MAIIWLIIYLISRYIVPVDTVIVRSILVIAFLLLVIYWLTGNTIIFWR